MDYFQKIIGDIEVHSVEGISECFENGVSPNDLFRGEPLIYELTSEYGRGPKFKQCVRAFVNYGLLFDDKILFSVLLDDSMALENLLQQSKSAIHREYTLRSAFIPLYKCSLLHICAEFDHVNSAEVLVKFGADVNARAGVDEIGLGGQTPVFHTVNQNNNQSAGMLQFLLSHKADLLLTVPGFIWGKGYEWETLIPAVNPISYAMMGLLRQMHRDEVTISKTVSLLLKEAYGIEYKSKNVPNVYLNNK